MPTTDASAALDLWRVRVVKDTAQWTLSTMIRLEPDELKAPRRCSLKLLDILARLRAGQERSSR